MKNQIVVISEKMHTSWLVPMLLGLLMNSAGCTSSGSSATGAAGGESGSGGSTATMGGVGGMGGMGGNGGAMGGMGGNGGAMGGMGGMPCTPIDDGNVCTDDLCVNGIPVHANVTLGTSCGANFVCNGYGACLLVPGQTCVSGSNCESETCLNGVCVANTDHWCTNGSQCPSHVCSNSVCITPQPSNGPLDWMTVLEFTSFSSLAQLDLLALSGLDNGGLAFVGEVPFSYTDIKLGGIPIPNCEATKTVFTGSLDGTGVLGAITLGKCFIAQPDIDVFRVQGGFGYGGVYSEKSHTGYNCDFYLGKWAAPAWSTTGPNRNVVGNDSGEIAAIVGDHQWPNDCAFWTSERLVKFDASGVKVFDVPIPQGFGQMFAIGSAGEFYTRTYEAPAIIIKKWDAAANLQWSTVALPFASAFDVDTLGNVLVAFSFNGTIDLGSGPMIATGIKDLGLAKLDPNGNVVWQKHFGSVGFELKTIGITHTGVSDPVVHGSIVGSTDLGDGPLQRTAFFAKFDASGNVLWHVDFDGLSVFPLFLHGNAAGEVFLGSESFLLDFGWGPPLAGKQGIIAAKYGP